LIITHVGGPTAVIELDGWRLLTDPTFDPAGGHYDFGWGTSSDKLTGPALSMADLPPIDAVLLTHDHHGDNLDGAGRALLPSVGTVITTVPAARRLGRSLGAVGLWPEAVTTLSAAGRGALEIIATHARHGPPLSRPIVGDVIGFAVRRAGERRTLVWVTGDTVLDRRVRRLARDLAADVLVVHVGGVQFPITGPLRYTLTGRRAVELIELARPRVAVPVHYEGWAHFRDGRAAVEAAAARAGAEVERRIRWLDPGTPMDLGD
jgi:L-ascorbate metabolism protein UlaG (beta-lactamase superfamily)